LLDSPTESEALKQTGWFDTIVSSFRQVLEWLPDKRTGKNSRLRVYRNSFATNHTITNQTVADIVLAGRTRWKVENENNNTLKTKGYNLEHNFGHGKQHLSSFLATLNILSLLFHTLLELLDEKYKLLRAH
jgi:hypothetical protein